MSGAVPTFEQLTSFGIRPEDDRLHPWSQDYEWWNESYFFDWFDAEGRRAGHCRVGLHPAQQRLWFWLFLYEDDEWIVLEEPRLPLQRFDGDKLAYEDPWGLSFSYTVAEPLRSGRLRCAGFGRVASGRRSGCLLPVSVDLHVEAAGPAHSVGEGKVAGHSAEGLSTNRYEQAIRVRGHVGVAGNEKELSGQGERDHSWGPRWWNMEWNFLVLGDDDFRLQAVHVVIPDVTEMKVGYLSQGGTTADLSSVEFDLIFNDEDPTRAVSGRFVVGAEDARGKAEISGWIEAISGAEIDITHCLVPPRPSIYRRSLVRCSIDGRSRPLVGWLESNRFVSGPPR